MEWLSNPIVQQVIAGLVPIILPFILGGITWLIVQGIKLLGRKVKESDTKIDDYLLGIAVKFAEDKIKGSGKGDEKLAEACDYIEEATNGRLKSEVVEPLVRAKYQEIFGELAKLKNA